MKYVFVVLILFVLAFITGRNVYDLIRALPLKNKKNNIKECDKNDGNIDSNINN